MKIKSQSEFLARISDLHSLDIAASKYSQLVTFSFVNKIRLLTFSYHQLTTYHLNKGLM